MNVKERAHISDLAKSPNQIDATTRNGMILEGKEYLLMSHERIEKDCKNNHGKDGKTVRSKKSNRCIVCASKAARKSYNKLHKVHKEQSALSKIEDIKIEKEIDYYDTL